MKRFRFRLQKVLDLRKRKEDECKEALLMANQALYLEQQKLDAIDHQIAEAQAKKATLQANASTRSSVLDEYFYFVQSLLTKRGNQVMAIHHAEEKVEEKRLILVEASKEREILDRLKEKQEHAYLLELDTLEQKQMDEIATYMDVKESPTLPKFRKLIVGDGR